MDSTADQSPTRGVLEAEIAGLRALFDTRQYASMAAAGRRLLDLAPDHRDVLLLLALAERYGRRIAEALAVLDRLERRYPRFSRLHQERGHCFIALQRAPEAIAAFVRAVELNASLPASWRMLEGLYRMTGDAHAAAAAARQVSTLARLPPEVVTAAGLFSDGDLDPAEALVRRFLLDHGDDVEGMRLLARIGMAREVFDDAELLLAAVLARAPDYRAAREDYAKVLLARHNYAPARAQFERLLGLDPDNRRYRTLYATCSVGLGEHALAIDIYRRLLAGDAGAAQAGAAQAGAAQAGAAQAGDAELHLSIAHAQKTLGESSAAVESYRRAAACRPDFGDAYWSLANLKTYRFTDAELGAIQSALAAAATAENDRLHLSFALAKALEDRGDYAESFRYYELGNGIRRAASKYRAEIIETNTRRQIEVCTHAFFASRRDVGAPDADPIFIVGLPRSGSTLLEQILASHSAVEGTQELAEIQRIVLALQGRDPDLDDPRYPRVLADMPPGEFAALGAQYLEETRVYRTGKPYFIDKMPNNFRHLGLIHLMLPRAKIIDARREPMACCFSNFKQLFANGQEFTYSLGDIARYYRTYLELMAHWDAVLPGRVLRVHHEDVVADLEGSVRRLLNFCGLAFEAGCVEFHQTARSVRTASSEQVRQPIFREGLDQWRHFEPWLAPLERALGDAVVRYRD
jgi:tetratricopeptide (TPR) repeat protein